MKPIVIFLTWFLFSCFSGTVSAQLYPCNADESTKRLLALHPEFIGLIKSAEHKAEYFATHSAKTYDAVVTIPVVVHVVYHTPVENISDAQIFSQMEVLNEDFRKLSPDISVIRDIFQPFAGDARLQFCLAQQDPAGNPSNGITRTYTNVTDFGCDDQVKFDTAGGKTGWDPSKYLNIWVCTLNCANGYAYYPGIPAEYDGVVIHNYVFGRTGYVANGYLGRTTCHEVGHWLGLYHTFYSDGSDTCEGNTAQTCASQGDKVCDTPKAASPDWDCVPRNSCVDSPVDWTDMYEDVMDYTSDGCRMMFTHGQIDRMNSFLYTARLSLLASPGCQTPGTVYYDAVAVGITQPDVVTCKNPVIPKVNVGNASSLPLTDLTINISLDGNPLNIFFWTGFLAAGQFAEITLPAAMVTPGNHTLQVTVSNPNGHPDEYADNDTTWYSFYRMNDNEGLILDYGEDFESGEFPPDGWTRENTEGDALQWTHRTNAGGFMTSNACAYFPNSSCWPDDTHDYLLTPWFNLTGYTSALMSFDIAYSAPDPQYLPLFSDTLVVYYSVDCSSDWVKIWEKGGNDLATAPPVIPFAPFTPNAGEWQKDTIVLNAVAGHSLVQFRFENRSGFGNDLFVDNINFAVPVGIPVIGKTEIKVFPTVLGPTSLLYVQVPGFSQEQLMIFDVIGQKVTAAALTSGTNAIDLSLLKPGVYFYQITSKHQVLKAGKLVIGN